MTNPSQNKGGILVPALAEYLAANTVISTAANWRYYSEAKADGPRGRIIIGSVRNGDRSNEVVIQKPQGIWAFSLMVMIWPDTDDELQELGNRWEFYLRDEIMPALWQTGLSTTIDSVSLLRAFRFHRYLSSSIRPTFNQDDGGVVKVTLNYQWDDEGTMSVQSGF